MLIIFLSGITFGLFLATIITLYLIKVKYPKCKQLRPLKEIILFNWKSRTITDQPCLKCQRPKPQMDIY